MPSTNPFRSIIPIPRANKLFLMAKNNVMKTSIRGTSESVPLLRRIRRKEATRIELLSKELRSRLFRIVEEFPRLEAEFITSFYVEILDISFNLDKIRKTLGSFSGAADVIWKIKREHLGDVWHANSVIEAKKLRRAAFGRMRSVIIKLDKRLEFIETVRTRMRGMPGIDLDQPTICIAGYPNVGKSSLVNAVTSATPEIGAYPFTTKEVTLGHLKIPIYISANSKLPISHIPAQIVDTPGILDRSLEERNEIELRAIAALKTLATAIVFIFDFTQYESLISQKNLFNQINQNFQEVPILLICSKADLLTESQKMELQVFLKQNFPRDDIHILSMNQKEGIKKLLFDFYEENHSQIQKIMNIRKIGEV
ncbi:MAG: 50S ribosome-binding GTPase [Candidatus Heimdallarchaeota archaeon]|nr:MAG: 50S ribosome-binding GTPase [Candidatus Heimdallarchaeota archaeon]